MDASSSDLVVSEIDYSELNIRSKQITVQEYIKILLERIGIEKEFVEIALCICKIILNDILESDDILNLSIIQNYFRKIEIASDLCAQLCNAFGQNVDFEFRNLVLNLLNGDKLKQISKKIMRDQKLRRQKEKIYLEEVQKLYMPIESNNMEDDLKKKKNLSLMEYHNKKSENLSPDVINDTQIATLLEEVTDDFENKTEIRDVLETEPSNIQSYLKSINEPENPTFQKSIENLDKLEQEIFDLSDTLNSKLVIADISEPKNVCQAKHFSPKHDFTRNNTIENQIKNGKFSEKQLLNNSATSHKSYNYLEEENFFSNLPTPTDYTVVKKRKKYTSVDKKTTIHDYAVRALQLNKNIINERIQVFEGPPNILQSMSGIHLMNNSSYGYSFNHSKKSSKLDILFKRNLLTEKKPHESFIFTGIGQERNVTYETHVLQHDSIEHKLNMGRQQSFLARQNLSDINIGKNKINEDFDQNDLIQHKNVTNNNNTSLSIPKVIQPNMKLFDNEVISVMSPKKMFETDFQINKDKNSNKNAPMFYISEKNPPSEKLTSFQHIMSKLEKLWLSNPKNESKEISIKQLFSSDDELNATNYLTLLRTLDKLSLRKKVNLKFDTNDILITPFKHSYITKSKIYF